MKSERRCFLDLNETEGIEYIERIILVLLHINTVLTSALKNSICCTKEKNDSFS